MKKMKMIFAATLVASSVAATPAEAYSRNRGLSFYCSVFLNSHQPWLLQLVGCQAAENSQAF